MKESNTSLFTARDIPASAVNRAQLCRRMRMILGPAVGPDKNWNAGFTPFQSVTSDASSHWICDCLIGGIDGYRRRQLHHTCSGPDCRIIGSGSGWYCSCVFHHSALDRRAILYSRQTCSCALPDTHASWGSPWSSGWHLPAGRFQLPAVESAGADSHWGHSHCFLWLHLDLQ